jgi:hypothetical protein
MESAMRYIPTFTTRLEQLKKEAKKLQRKGGGKHTDLLNLVARSAGYEHWHHAVLCHKETSRRNGGLALLAECSNAVLAEQEGRVIVSITGPEIAVGPFLVISTGVGDAWLLSPNERLGLCLMWRGETNEPKIEDTGSHIRIAWDVEYELLGDFFRFDPIDSKLKTQAVGGYPMDAIRVATFKLESFEQRHSSVISQDDAKDLTKEVIAQLILQGWPEDDLCKCAEQGFRYSPSRNSLLSPLEFSENF